MARGQQGQAAVPDPKKGNKVEPTTKAKPYGGKTNPHQGHGHKGKA